MAMTMLGLYSGTFDPIHLGHLGSVESLLDELPFESIQILPSARPPHRDVPCADPAHRLNMVSLALAGNAKLFANDFECSHGNISYSIDTLMYFRENYADKTLLFIAGMDAYMQMPQWKDHRAFLSLAHIVVMNRPGYLCVRDHWGDAYVTHRKDDLRTLRCGKIYFAATAHVDISSSAIRDVIREDGDLSGLVPQTVIAYIKQHQLYATA